MKKSLKIAFGLLGLSPFLLYGLGYTEKQLYLKSSRYCLARNLVLMPFGFISPRDNFFEHQFFGSYRSSVDSIHACAKRANYPKVISEKELAGLEEYLQEKRSLYETYEFQDGIYISKDYMTIKYYAVEKGPTVYYGVTHYSLIKRDPSNLKVVAEKRNKGHTGI